MHLAIPVAAVGLSSGLLILSQAVPDVPGLGGDVPQWTLQIALLMVVGWLLGRTVPGMMAAAEKERAAHADVVKTIVEKHEQTVVAVSTQAHGDAVEVRATLNAIAAQQAEAIKVAAADQNTVLREMVQHCAATVAKIG